MRILHLSDLHLGKSFYTYDLTEDQRFIFSQVYSAVRERQVDALLISGDVFHRTAPSSQTVSLLDEFLSHLVNKEKISILMIAGNHDSPQRLAFGQSLFSRSGLYIGGTVCHPLQTVTLCDQWGDVDFYFLPYFISQEIRTLLDDSGISGSNSAFSRLMDDLMPTMNLSRRAVLLAHGFFTYGGGELSLSREEEVSVGPADLIDLSPWAKLFDYIALGHIHRPQQVGQKQIRYSGSPLPYSLSEIGVEKSMSLVTLEEKGTIFLEEIPLRPLRQARILEDTFDSLMEDEKYAPYREDYVFARLTDNSLILNAMTRLRSRFPYCLGLDLPRLDFQNGSQEGYIPPSRETLPLPELFAQFYQEMKGEELSPAQKKLTQTVFERIRREEA